MDKGMNIKNNFAVAIFTIIITLSVILVNIYLFYIKGSNIDNSDYLLMFGVALLIPYVLATINSILKGNVDMSIKFAFRIAIFIIIGLAIFQFALVFSQATEFENITNITSLLLITGFAIFIYFLYYLIQGLAVKHKVIFHIVFIILFILTGVLSYFNFM